jgi:hypothetical protein
VPHNEFVGQVDALMSTSVTIGVTSSNAYTVTTEQLTNGFRFEIGNGASDATAAMTISLPATVRGLMYWRNTLAFPATIQKTGGQTEAAPVVAANSATLIEYDGSNARYAVPSNGAEVPETASNDYKDSVRVRVTSVTLATPGATLDGETMASGDSFFLDNGLATAGIYDWNGAATPATRRVDADTDAEVTSGMIVTVVEGTYGGKFYQLATLDPIVVDTTALDFIEVTPAGAAKLTNLVVQYSSFTADNLDVIAGYENRILVINNGSNNVTVTVPAALMSNNSRFGVFRLGAGTVTLVESGTTIYSSGSVLLIPRYCTALLQRRSSTIWHQLYPLIDASAGGGTAASTTEALTGTDTAKFITANALAALWEKGSDEASAGTVSFGEGGYFHITGTTTITDLDFDTAKDGRAVTVQFDGILTLTHHATTLVLPTGANITTAAGDTACFIQDSGDNIKCLWYQRADGTPLAGGGGGSTQGKHTIFIPAAAMIPATTSGAAAAQIERTTNKQNIVVLDFDANADEYAHFQVAFPKSWNLGTVTFQAFWTTTATGTAGVAWGLEAVAISDNEAIDASWGTAVVVTDAAQSGAYEQLVTAESGAVTIGGTPADDDLLYFRVFRDVSDAADTMSVDAKLIGIKLFYTTDADTDA